MTITHLLWIDLETTGTDEERDEIIEAGWILTDTNLVALDRGEFAADISIHLREARQYRAMWASLPPWLGEMELHSYVDRVDV